MYHSAQRTDAFAHIRPPRTQIVAHSVVKAEHGSRGFSPTTPSAYSLYPYRNGHADHWGKEAWHQKVDLRKILPRKIDDEKTPENLLEPIHVAPLP